MGHININNINNIKTIRYLLMILELYIENNKLEIIGDLI